MTSLSSKLDACSKFLKTSSGQKSNGVIYWVKSHSAQTIREFSEYPAEDEFILLPGTKLKLLKKIQNTTDSNITEVLMEELSPTASSKKTKEKARLIELIVYLIFRSVDFASRSIVKVEFCSVESFSNDFI